MKSLLIMPLIFCGGLCLGLKAGERKMEKVYTEYLDTHKFTCWTPPKKPKHIGDYPYVFVIETTEPQTERSRR